MDIWQRSKCPHCGQQNWLNVGDTNDLTARDTDALKCWSCQQRFFLDVESIREVHGPWIKECVEPADYDTCQWESLDQFLREGANCEWGRRSPDDPYKALWGNDE